MQCCHSVLILDPTFLSWIRLCVLLNHWILDPVNSARLQTTTLLHNREQHRINFMFKERKLHVIILHCYCLLCFPCLLCTCTSRFNNLKDAFWIALSRSEISFDSFRNCKTLITGSTVLFAYLFKINQYRLKVIALWRKIILN